MPTDLFDRSPDSNKLSSKMRCPTFLVAIFLLASIAVSDVFAFPASLPNSPSTRSTCPNTFVGVCCRRSDGSNELVSEVANLCVCAQLQGTGAPSQQCHPAVRQAVPCACPRILSPVCCRRNGVVFTAANACLCKCRGGIVIRKQKGCGGASR